MRGGTRRLERSFFKQDMGYIQTMTVNTYMFLIASEFNIQDYVFFLM